MTSRMKPSWIVSWFRLVMPVVLATSACSSGSSKLALSATSTSQATDGGDDAGVPSDGGSSDAGISLCDRLLVDRVRVVVRRIDLERAASADAGTDAGTDAGMSDAAMASCDCPDGGMVCLKPGGHVHIGPFLVDVSGSDLAGGIHQVFDAEIPQGTYEDVRFVINTVSRHQANADGGVASDGGLSGMQDLHASIAVDGSFDGAAFQFKTSMRVAQKQEGPFEVGADTKNVILTLDPSRWFVAQDGKLLDPTDPRNRGRILANIRCSVRMSSEEHDQGRSFRREFDDDDDRDHKCREDDDDDHGEHGDDLSVGLWKHEGGQAGDHGGDDDHHSPRVCSAPTLVCGDGGIASPDAGTDGGPDGG